MTRVLLVRHATCAPVGRALAGRATGIDLSEAGREQAAALAERLAGCGASAVYSSPLERAMQTAQTIGARLHVAVAPLEGLVELDVGAWTGRTIASLDQSGGDEWKRFNVYRSGTRAPGGELQLEAQARAVRALLRLADRHPTETILAVSHADVIKSVLAHALGVAIDLQHRIEIAPASVSVIELAPWGPLVGSVNWRADGTP
jgi:broad specificity phosphatase PhoE